MAGDWLKFELNTPEKPEVLAITIELGYDDPDLTVGKLLKVWRWFDQHTLDGNAPSVTPALLDRLIGVTGITQAMSKVGWLDIYVSGGVGLPHFDRHNGKTAKERALTAKRVASHKASKDANGIGNGDSVSSALPREEKRREDINRGSRLPKDWTLPDEWIFEARKINSNLSEKQIRFIADNFRDYWIAKTGKDAVKGDWLATWRNWIRRQEIPVENRNNQPNKSGLVL